MDGKGFTILLSMTPEGLERFETLIRARDPGLAAIFKENKVQQFAGFKFDENGFLVE